LTIYQFDDEICRESERDYVNGMHYCVSLLQFADFTELLKLKENELVKRDVDV